MQTFYRYSILILWTAWWLYWTVAAIAAKPATRRENVTSRVSHLVPLLLGFALLMSPRLAGFWLDQRFLPHNLAWFWLGFACVAIGLVFAVWARVCLGGNWSGLVTLKQDHELIRHGPYRSVRHPIYTGLLLAVLGSTIALGEWRGLLGLLLIAVAFIRKLRIEEQFLSEQFGEAYARYRAEVPALVPRLRR